MWERLELIGIVVKVYAGIILKTLFPVVLWLTVAWYFDITFVVALLALIAISICGLSLTFQTYQAQATDAQPLKAKRDFYIVIDANYTWNILEKSSRHDLKPDTLNELYTFEDFGAARAMFEAASREHYADEDRPPWLEYPDAYMDGSRYFEYEARLWVIPALSKQEAYDKAFYDDSQRLLGYGSGATTSHLVSITNNDKRRQEYKTWWHERMDYRRYLDSRNKYLKEHPDVTPRFAELDIDEWRDLTSDRWPERAMPGHP
jgi:hypothetical protein